MRGVQRAVAEAMIAALEGDNAVASCGHACGFQGGFDGFESGGTKNRPSFGSALCPSFEGDGAELLGEDSFQGVRVHVPHGVREFGELLLSGANDVRGGVPQGGDTKCRSEIQVSFSVHVPDPAVFSTIPNDGPAPLRIDKGDVWRFELAQSREFDFAAFSAHEFSLARSRLREKVCDP